MRPIALFLTLVYQASSLEALTEPLFGQITKLGTNKFVSVQSACSRRSVMAVLALEEPFHGIVYAKGYPLECREIGNGSTEVRITIPIDECGAKIIEKEDGTLVYEVLLYVQHDRQVQVASDDQITVKCTPREIVVTSATGKHLTRITDVPETVKPLDYWMDIMKGKMPFIRPITDHVNVGEEITMVVKVRQKVGITAKVTSCLAHDGSRQIQQDLTDKNGCTVDSNILPELQEKVDGRNGIKIIYSTFPAFKFPEKDSLHLQCRVLICNGICPLQSCANKNKVRFSRSSKGALYRRSNILNEFSVFNSVEVKAPEIDEKELSKIKGPNSSQKLGYYNSELLCLSSTRIVVVVLLLLTVLMVSLVVTICMCVRTRELRRRISQRNSMSYGRVIDFT